VHWFPDEEATVRQLIESLSPEAHRIYWKWIGGVFAFYVAVMVAAAGVLMSHQSARTPTQEVAASTMRGKPRSIAAPATPLSQVAVNH
jgi:hypothetical protein